MYNLQLCLFLSASNSFGILLEPDSCTTSAGMSALASFLWSAVFILTVLLTEIGVLTNHIGWLFLFLKGIVFQLQAVDRRNENAISAETHTASTADASRV